MSNSPDELKVQMQRDGASLLMMGIFFGVLGFLVIVGTLWALARPHAAIVNFGAGVVLLVIGGGFLLVGRHLNRMAARRPGSPVK